MSEPAATPQIVASESTENTHALDALTVLLVDDSAFACSVGKRALHSAGIRSVLEATSGRRAIEILGQSALQVDVVFCDLMMPDMDGIQMVRHIATLATPPAIVFVSAADEILLSAAENTARARGLRVIGAIEKPLTAEAVRRALARLGEKPLPGGNRNSVDVTAEDLEIGLAKQQFLPDFQPKVSIADHSLAGFESLARWKHPVKGIIFPDAFIPIAERTGQIAALTDQITMLSLKQCAEWALAGLRTKVSINLSAHMLVDLNLPDRMSREAEMFRVDPQQVILEITESGLFHDAANTLDILARLRIKGFSLSIDDFGTGYSSMEQLRRVPFAEMKIDHTFVRGACRNAKAMAILESSASLARSLNMTVVAEGVETQEDWNAVRNAGVDFVQGYFVAKPMPAEKVPEWLIQWMLQHSPASLS